MGWGLMIVLCTGSLAGPVLLPLPVLRYKVQNKIDPFIIIHTWLMFVMCGLAMHMYD